MGKRLTEAQRLEKLMKLAQLSQKLGSMSEDLSPEVFNRERDFSALTKRLKGTETPSLPKPEHDRLMNTPYGLPHKTF